MDEEATQLTQGVADPRRTGEESPTEDTADTICILHPCTPAAMRVAARAAARGPQHVLHLANGSSYEHSQRPDMPDESETFILPGQNGHPSPSNLELALRFSSTPVKPWLGFLFGRSRLECDFQIDTNDTRRVSNIHFRIFLNELGVLMLQDLSTNGTMVNLVRLRGKGAPIAQTRTLRSGDMITILSESDEVKFIVRIPSRVGCEDRYTANLKSYIGLTTRLAEAQTSNTPLHRLIQTVPRINPATGGMLPMYQPIRNQNWGMHWDGSPSYNVSGTLGKGAFATVYLLTTKSEGHYLAAKELEKRRFIKDGTLDRRLENELNIMKNLRHRNIVQFLDYKDYHQHLYIIMEYVGYGDLQGYINANDHMPEPTGKLVAAQVFEALTYLHDKSVTHRDIKPDNILIANNDPANFWIKLTDFGLSKVVKDNESLLKTFCGTLLYCAPEVFPFYDQFARRKRTRSNVLPQYHSYSKSVDIWSFGAVLWYALCGQVPFTGVTDATGEAMFNQIMSTELVPDHLLRVGVPPLAWDLLAATLDTDPSRRPTARQCRQHCWFDDLPPPADDDPIHRGELAPSSEDANSGRISEPDLSQLRLEEHDPKPLEAIGRSTSDLEALDPRESKRVKEYTSPKRQRPARAGLDTSTLMPRRQLAFGEDENRVDVTSSSRYTNGSIDEYLSLREVIEDYTGPVVHPDDSDTDDSPPLDTPSGTTDEMASTVQVDSPSAHEESDCPATPKTPPTRCSHDDSRDAPVAGVSTDVDTTPKPAPLKRRIDLPLSASYFYDPHDPTTHNTAYASAMSGHDFATNPTLLSSSFVPPLSSTALGERKLVTAAANNAFVKPPPRLGRLVSTPESFTEISIPLTAPLTTWGRAPNNTNVYPFADDTRISKRGLILMFGAAQLKETVAAGKDWTKLTDLHCMIATDASSGIWVNGKKLTKHDAKGRPSYGVIHTGDVITMIRGQAGSPGPANGMQLEFNVEIFHGLGREPRQQGKAFQVLHNSTQPNTSAVDQPQGFWKMAE